MTRSVRITRLATVTASLAIAVLPTCVGVAVAHTATRALPAGCGLGIQSQGGSTIVGHTQTFRFHGYNAVPPGDAVTDVRFTWGDGTASAGRATASAKRPRRGCVDTTFSARHTYTRTHCTGLNCATTYPVTIGFTDARTGAKRTLRHLSVLVVRPAKTH
jgi:hypothetical protein